MGDEKGPSPSEPRDSAEFVAHLRLLKQQSGLTYRQLEKRAAECGKALARSTLADVLRRDTLPRPELLAAFVHACGEGRHTRAWLERRDSIAASERCRVTVPLREEPAPAEPPTEPTAVRARRLRPHVLRGHVSVMTVSAAAVLVLAIAMGVWVLAPGGVADGAASGDCPDALAPGEYGPCVRQVQLHLRQHALDLPVDASFGPLTRARVAAFQGMSRLPVTGVVDRATRDALDHRGSTALAQARRWSSARVERRLRVAFPEDPGAAVTLARCLSNLDPLWAWDGGSADRSAWRWGLFQLTDQDIKGLGGTTRNALDPEWNIRAGRAIWERERGFVRWTCHPARAG
ncbi:peptidoglycan-binding domain-containing protein [Streptomyces sp. Qhu-G9]|uniref:peptidoglycan-binding domain-containing protein n=1 Tax=Streptomyces sp. Qhu-G9 TaxID=3452799 RepID=UPI0022AC1C36|nr:peptidoglycan-binding domain-containing protein [Streptomyces aurantiacus]WAU83668.1 peptidoglycan-binding domain-containing protein [Streptomyces aurantiacus]